MALSIHNSQINTGLLGFDHELSSLLINKNNYSIHGAIPEHQGITEVPWLPTETHSVSICEYQAVTEKLWWERRISLFMSLTLLSLE